MSTMTMTQSESTHLLNPDLQFADINAGWHGEVQLNQWPKISCTTVFIPVDGARNLQSHIFRNLPIDPYHIGSRFGILSINVGTLLDALRLSLHTGNCLVPRTLAKIIAGVAGQNVEVATTRVPMFFEQMPCPSNGYRVLGSISSIKVRRTQLAPEYDDVHELLAIKTGNHSEEYVETWKPMALAVDSHFILIFSFQGSTSTSSANLANSLLARHGPSAAPISRSGSFGNLTPSYPPSPLGHTPSPPGSTSISRAPSIPPIMAPCSNVYNPSLDFDLRAFDGVPVGMNDTLPNMQVSHYNASATDVPLGTSNASPNMQFPHHNGSTDDVPFYENNTSLNISFLHNGGSTEEVPFGEDDASPTVQSPHHNGYIDGIPFDENGESNTLSDLQHKDICGTVAELCSRFGITPDVVAAARYNAEKDKSLVAMVLNYRAMSRILLKFGYYDENNSFVKAKIVKFGGGLEFSTGDMLKSFGWTIATYSHKLKWYTWAENVTNNNNATDAALGE